VRREVSVRALFLSDLVALPFLSPRHYSCVNAQRRKQQRDRWPTVNRYSQKPNNCFRCAGGPCSGPAQTCLQFATHR
jgi:hypothetical protein